ncbi:MAG TPA: nucleoside-diphosphate sugar epimerase/dehydratase [Clostridia bacterium]|nr:nucleoside-diphosphate sugar epimerase/dehydratase [Clostridia bacterium]
MGRKRTEQKSTITKSFSLLLNRFHLRIDFRCRIVFLALLDLILVQVSALGALLLRFEFTLPEQYFSVYRNYALATVLIMFLSYVMFQLYRSLWRYASVDELVNIVLSNLAGVLLLRTFIGVTGGFLPRSFYPIFLMLVTASTGGVRFMYRYFRQIRTTGLSDFSNKNRALVIGAGEAGDTVVREMTGNPLSQSFPVGLIDDNPSKLYMTVHGVKVLGNRNDIQEISERESIDEIILAMPRIDSDEKKKIIDICKETGCRLRTLPGVNELIDGKVSVSKLRDVAVEDLLGREPVKLNIDEMCEYITGKTVLITGGAGSIGSELCRQIAKYKPEKLIITEINENASYELQRELERDFPDLDLKVHIASMRDRKRMEELFKSYRPHKVFHAAAHKHVPLMENDPIEAVKNNVFGTLNIVELAHEYGVKKFAMISTDKAVNPTNVMGATKRIAEKIIQAKNKESQTDFVAVRFGNVLGSSGSVIPIFKRQIAHMGPVTVTHPDIIRYFMTIPEAVSLVLQAGAMARGGEIFVLDMGDPVKIYDLARDLIRLSGYEPGKDIKIEFTGLRPGEKLFEELLMDEEGIKKTQNKKIHIGKANHVTMADLGSNLEALRKIANSENEDMIHAALMDLVETYKRAM